MRTVAGLIIAVFIILLFENFRKVKEVTVCWRYNLIGHWGLHADFVLLSFIGTQLIVETDSAKGLCRRVSSSSPEIYNKLAKKFQFYMNAVQTNRKNTHTLSASLLLLCL